MKLAERLVHAAAAQKLTLTTAESCTGGMIAAAITDVTGASAVFEKGCVTYSNAAKTDLLDVPSALFIEFGAVSEEVAKAMAQGALQNAPADIALSVTGIAGPGGSEHKPEGRVCFGLAQNGHIRTETVEFGALGRAHVRAAARDHGLDLLWSALRSAV